MTEDQILKLIDSLVTAGILVGGYYGTVEGFLSVEMNSGRLPEHLNQVREELVEAIRIELSNAWELGWDSGNKNAIELNYTKNPYEVGDDPNLE
jgi:hypothetical protein